MVHKLKKGTVLVKPAGKPSSRRMIARKWQANPFLCASVELGRTRRKQKPPHQGQLGWVEKPRKA